MPRNQAVCFSFNDGNSDVIIRINYNHDGCDDEGEEENVNDDNDDMGYTGDDSAADGDDSAADGDDDDCKDR